MILLNVSHSHSVFTISLPNSVPYCQIEAQGFYLVPTLFLRKFYFPNRSPGALIGKPYHWPTMKMLAPSQMAHTAAKCTAVLDISLSEYFAKQQYLLSDQLGQCYIEFLHIFYTYVPRIYSTYYRQHFMLFV